MRTDTPEASYSIVVLGAKDAGELAALEAECFSMPWSEACYRDILGAVDRALGEKTPPWNKLPPFMALGLREPDASLAAYICLGLHQAAGELEIYNIAVASYARRRGYGKALLSRALAMAAAGGITRAVLEVRTGNTAALALYAGAGFLECGRRKGYYTDTGEDALVLCLECIS